VLESGHFSFPLAHLFTSGKFTKMNLLQRIFSSDGFMPHGMCYEWNPDVIWLHVLSDGLITLAYYSIPITLIYFVRKRKDLAFDWIFVCFATFIVACGTTHLMEIINIWHPVYWLSGIIKGVTAITSVVTAILLIRLVPQALALPSPEQLRTSNRALEKEIQERTKASEEIVALNRNLLLQTEKLEESNKELETFSASVAHDFRAPLRVIVGYAEMEIADHKEKLPTSTGFALEKVISSANRLNDMMTDLLAYHRASREDFPPQELNLSSVVSEIVKEPQFSNGQFEIQEELGTVTANPVGLNIILTNLIANAQKFVDEGVISHVTITSQRDGNGLTLFLRDNGVGIEESDQTSLFKIFYRGHHKKNFAGTGLGLCTAQKAAIRAGATLSLLTSSPEGSCFSIFFPASKV
jgi:signal transduction histidine kinase